MEKLVHELEKQNFFYDLITTMAYSQFGQYELFSRGFIMGKFKEFPNFVNLKKEIQRFNFPYDVEQQIFSTKTFTPLIFVPIFRTKTGKTVYRMDPNQEPLKSLFEIFKKYKVSLIK